jgi:queuine tRNA-ribosyltransferase
MNMKNAKWKEDFSPIDIQSKSFTSRNHSKSYLRHLFHVKELLAAQIASLHNLSFFLELVQEARIQIINGNFNSWKSIAIPKLQQRL